MAIPAARLIPTDNLDILFTGGAIHGEKTVGSKAQRKGGAITGGAIHMEKIDGSKAQKNQEIIEEQSNIMVDLVRIYDDFGGYGHNHEECIEEQRNMVDFVGCGLDDIHDGPPFLPLASKLRSHPPMPSEELYEWGEPLVFEESPFGEEMPVLVSRPTWPMLFHEEV